MPETPEAATVGENVITAILIGNLVGELLKQMNALLAGQNITWQQVEEKIEEGRSLRLLARSLV